MHRLALLSFAAGVWFLGGAGSSWAEDEAKAILDKAIQAHGGQEELAAIKAEKIKSIVVKHDGDQVREKEFLEVKLLKTLNEKEFAAPLDNELKGKAKLKGEVKSIGFDSKHLSKTRGVKIYLPPGHDPKKRYPVLYAADGFDAVDCARLEPLITAGKVPPFIVVGTEAAPGQGRQKEYCPGWIGGKEAFETHEKFFIEEVLPWAEKEFGASPERKNRIVYGSSNGAPFALTMANRHPKLFGHVFAFMVYALKLDLFEKELNEQPKDPTRYLLVVGSEDAHGIKENQAIEKLLKKRKFPVVSVIIKGMGHSSQLEYQELPGCVETALGNKKYQPKGKSIAIRDFSEKPVTDAQLKELVKDLKELKNLHSLSFVDSAQLTDEGLKELRKALKDLKELRVLFLGGTGITDAGLKELRELKTLQRLGLGRTRVTDAGLKELKELKELRQLDLSGCDKVTRTSIDELKSALPKLQITGREDLLLSEEEAPVFKAVQKLGARIDIEGKSITVVDFSQKPVTDVQLKELMKDFKELKNLQFLSFVGSAKLTDEGLKELGKALKDLKELRVLFLGGTGITDAGLKELRELKTLQRLGLGRTRVTDAGLKEVKHFKKLQVLFLANTQVTDEGLKELKELKGLRGLILSGCAKVTQAAIDDLKTSLPELEIAR